MSNKKSGFAAKAGAATGLAWVALALISRLLSRDFDEEKSLRYLQNLQQHAAINGIESTVQIESNGTVLTVITDNLNDSESRTLTNIEINYTNGDSSALRTQGDGSQNLARQEVSWEIPDLQSVVEVLEDPDSQFTVRIYDNNQVGIEARILKIDNETYFLAFDGEYIQPFLNQGSEQYKFASHFIVSNRQGYFHAEPAGIAIFDPTSPNVVEFINTIESNVEFLEHIDNSWLVGRTVEQITNVNTIEFYAALTEYVNLAQDILAVRSEQRAIQEDTDNWFKDNYGETFGEFLPQ